MDAEKKPEGFVPYGTPCSDLFDPSTQRLELMRCELDQLRTQIDALIAARDEEGENEQESDCA
jgi:serine O-acetyltransferase